MEKAHESIELKQVVETLEKLSGSIGHRVALGPAIHELGVQQ